MSKNVHYLLLLIILIIFTGCQTIKGATCGAASGLNQDVQNISNPDQNGWNALKKADAWVQENLW